MKVKSVILLILLSFIISNDVVVEAQVAKMASTLGKIGKDVGKAVKDKAANPLEGIKKYTAANEFEFVHEL